MKGTEQCVQYAHISWGKRCFMYMYTSTSSYLDIFGFRVQVVSIRDVTFLGIFDFCISFQKANSKRPVASSSSKRLSESILFLSWNSVGISRVDGRDI